MKKTKLGLVATLTAVTFAFGCGALVACNDAPDDQGPDDTAKTTYEVTFDANGGAYAQGATTVKLTTDENGRIAAKPTADPTREDYTFNGYNVKQDGTGTAVTFGATGYQFKAATTVYAQWKANETPEDPEDPEDPEEPVEEFTVTLNVGEGTLADGVATTLTTVDDKLESLPTPTAPDGSWFKGWYTEQNGNGEQVTVEYTFTAEEGEEPTATIYAYYIAEATITLDVGSDGTLAEGVETTLTTVNGKINGRLPVPTASVENWSFDDWYDATTGGTAIVEAEYEFTEDTTIYAQYIRDDGLWYKDGETFIHALTVNTGCTDHLQYWLDGNSVTLNENDEVSIYINGKLMTYTVYQTSSCINVPSSSARVTSVTVSKDASFVLYLNEWNPNDWQVEYTGTPLTTDTTDVIPTGCEAITITFSNGTVTFYLVAPDGTAINSTNAANYQVHAWQTGNTAIFGAWNSNPTLDGTISVTEELKSDIIFMFHWSGGQSTNVTNISINKAFVVELVTSGDCTVKEYTGEAPEAPAPAPDEGEDAE